jgi:hypothetical protein
VSGNFNNKCATTQDGEPQPISFPTSRSVWYTFSFEEEKNISVEFLCVYGDGGCYGVGLRLALYSTTGSSCDPATLVADSVGNIPLLRNVVLKAGTYLLQVDGYSGSFATSGQVKVYG